MDDALVVGAGMVGTWAARALASHGLDVWAADPKPAPGYFTRFSGLTSDRLLALDGSDTADLHATVHRHSWKVIVYCAGTGPRPDPPDADIERVRNLASWLKGSDTRFVHVSSLAVYGTTEAPLSERATPSPRTEYGERKLAEEEAILATPDLDCVILRASGLFGPIRHNRGSHSARFLDTALRQALVHGEVQLKGSRHWGDEYLYVEDFAEALARAATRDLQDQRILNIGTGEQDTVEGVARALEGTVPGVQVRCIHEEGQRKPLPPLDVSLAQKTLDFTPRHNLLGGLRECASMLRTAP